ncbi:MAG: S41 family peptidase, partial [Gemmatimonadota bacterium]
LDNGIAHLKFFSLAGEAASEAVAAIDGLAAQRMRGLVLDLRGVADGSFANGLRLADYFLRAGSTIVSSRGRRAGSSTKSVDSVPEPHPELALVVLVDRGTAGAAELVAGALQDHDRALVLGETTFGRGSVQTLFPMQDGYSLRLSTAVWVTPAGRVIQHLPPREDGADTDSVPPRPKYKTEAGRLVQGGGGIVPDHGIRLTGADGADLGLATARSLLERSSSPKALLTLALQP